MEYYALVEHISPPTIKIPIPTYQKKKKKKKNFPFALEGQNPTIICEIALY